MITKSFNINWEARTLNKLDQFCIEKGLSRSKALEYMLFKELGEDLAEIPIWRENFWEEIIQESYNQNVQITLQEKDGVYYSTPFLNYVNVDFWKGISINTQKQREYSIILFITKQDIVVQLRLVSQSKKKRNKLEDLFNSNKTALTAAGFDIKPIKTDFVIECRKTVCKNYIPNGKDWFDKLKLLEQLF